VQDAAGVETPTFCPGRHSRETNGDPVWCLYCRGQIRGLLNQLPRLAKTLYLMHGAIATEQSARKEHRAGAASPALSPSYLFADEIIQWACSWEDACRRLLGAQPASRPSWGPGGIVALFDAVSFLNRSLIRILEERVISQDFGLELAKLHRSAIRATGEDQSYRRMRAPCPVCDLVALSVRSGEDQVRCRHCGRTMSLDEYERWAKICAFPYKWAEES